MSLSASVEVDLGSSLSYGTSTGGGGSESAPAAASGTAATWNPCPVSRFYVRIDGIHQAIFTEVSGLNLEVDVMTYEEGGNNTTLHRLPGRTKPSNLSLKRGLTRSNDFLQWLMKVAAGKVERKNVSLILYDASGEALLQWDFIHAFPFKWSCNPFRADSTEVAVESLELAYEAIQMNGSGNNG